MADILGTDILGTIGDDILNGTNGDDTITTFEGNDIWVYRAWHIVWRGW